MYLWSSSNCEFKSGIDGFLFCFASRDGFSVLCFLFFFFDISEKLTRTVPRISPFSICLYVARAGVMLMLFYTRTNTLRGFIFFSLCVFQRESVSLSFMLLISFLEGWLTKAEFGL